MKLFHATRAGAQRGDTTLASSGEIVFPGVGPGVMLGLQSSRPTNLVEVVEVSEPATVEALEQAIDQALRQSSFSTRHGAARCAATARLAARQIVQDAARYDGGSVLAFVEAGRYQLRGQVVDGVFHAADGDIDAASSDGQLSMFS